VKTWDDLLRYSDRLTKEDGGKIVQLGFPYNLPGLEEFATWAYANGGETQDVDVTKALFNSPQVADMLHYRATQYQRFGVNRSPDLKGDLFKIQKQAMEHTSTGLQVAVNGGTYVPKGFQYWFIPTPKGPSGSGPGMAAWVNMVRGADRRQAPRSVLRSPTDDRRAGGPGQDVRDHQTLPGLEGLLPDGCLYAGRQTRCSARHPADAVRAGQDLSILPALQRCQQDPRSADLRTRSPASATFSNRWPTVRNRSTRSYRSRRAGKLREQPVSEF